MRHPRASAQIVRRVARIPGASRLAQAVARNAAGRHHVGAMAVVTIAGDGTAVPMVLLARHTFHGDRWALPGGWVRRREDPAAACAREVGEEMGIAVRAVELLGCELHAVDGVPVRYGGLTIAYRCELLRPDDRDPRSISVELAEVGWIPADEAMALVTGFERAMIAKALPAAGDSE